MSTPSPPGSRKAGSGHKGGAPAPAGSGANVWGRCLLAWLVPGAGHVQAGQFRKGVIFFGILVTMFGIGLAFGGRLFPFQTSAPLVFLAAAAEWMLLLPRLLASLGGLGRGDVVAITYEYGNTFLIVAGLLNALVVLDVFDLATGRRKS